jgi:hypothetical protein
MMDFILYTLNLREREREERKERQRENMDNGSKIILLHKLFNEIKKKNPTSLGLFSLSSVYVINIP